MGKAADYMSRTRIGAHFHELRESRKLILVIVALGGLALGVLIGPPFGGIMYQTCHVPVRREVGSLHHPGILGPFRRRAAAVGTSAPGQQEGRRGA